MNEYIINITLDINCRKSVTRLFMGQYDIGRKAEVTVTADGEPYTCKNCTVVCQGVRGDRTHFAFDCTVNSAGHIITTFDEILKSNGIAYAKFVISDSTHSYSTEKIIIDCENALLGNIVNVNDYVTLNQLIERLHALSESGAVLVDTELSENSSNPIANYVIASIIYKLIETKADTIKLLPACEGAMTFTPYSNFILGQVGSTSGTYNPDIKYRVTSEDIMKFDYDLNVSVDSGFTAYVVKYADGTYESIKSLSDTNGYVIPANTEFRLHIRKNTIEAIENPIDRPTADINEFVNAVKFQTKTASDIAKANQDISEIGNNLKATDNALMGELPLKWLQGNVPPLGGGAGNRIIAVLGLMAQPFTISWTDENRVVKVWGYDSDTYDNRTKEISVSSGDTITPAQNVYYVIVTRTEDSAVIKPAYGDNVMVNVAFQKIKELDGRIKTVEDNLTAQYDNEHIPDYYYENDYLPNKIKEIREASAIMHGVTFAFLTDVHFKANQKQSKKLLRKVLDETNVPFVLCGGDIVYLVGTEEELYEQITDFNEFKSCIGKDRLFCTRGNHDLYNGERENLFNFNEWVDALQAHSKPVYNGTLVSVDKNNETLTFSSTGGDCYTVFYASIFKIPVKPSTSYSLSFKQEGAQGLTFVFFNGSAQSEQTVSANSSNGKLNFTTKEDTKYITLRFGIQRSNPSGSTATVSDIKLYKDDNVLTTADVYDTLFRDTETKVSSMSVDNGCYCIDNEPQKTRIIMLNTTDVSQSPEYRGGGVSFRPETLQWLSAALTEKTDYKIIIVCHTPLNYETFTNDVNFGENRDGLSLMVQAFKNKTEFETTRFETTVNADFTNTTNELICVISGHRHIDDYSLENNVLNIVTTCDCIDKKDGYGRKAGTISEQAFDVFCINYDTNTINTVRIGAGSNREFTY